jgi:hypothetical protein
MSNLQTHIANTGRTAAVYDSMLCVNIGILGDGIQLGPLSAAATNRPIVPAPVDYDDGEIGGMIVRGNRSTRRKPAPMLLCPP